jgi:hypothetical protein
MEVIEPFLSHFRPKDLDEFDEDPSIIYGLTADLNLGLLNQAWFAAARAQGAPPDFFDRFGLGGSFLDGVAGLIQPFFDGHIRQSIETGEPWEFDYQCPMPHQFRMFRMHVLPLGTKDGCLVTNASIVEIPRPEDDEAAAEDILASYLGAEGFVIQCAHCRRTRRIDAPARWDWVPQLVWDSPAPVSHSICPPCYAYFYPREE